ncbi:hypothetical protein AB4114_09670 [Paenibacillus sp. 2RAB27]
MERDGERWESSGESETVCFPFNVDFLAETDKLAGFFPVMFLGATS